MRATFLFCCTFVLFACEPPAGKVPPFIAITLVNPSGFLAPIADRLHVTNQSFVNGNSIFKEFDVTPPDQDLPTRACP
jgi:hypothetical protein